MSGFYERAFRGVLFPLYESGLRRRKTLAYLREREAEQWLPPERIRELQWQRLKALLQHCWDEVPYYRARWQEIGATPGDIHDMDDYARLPVLTKDDIRENFDAIQARSAAGGMQFKTTGGSTGRPLRLGYTRESYERRVAVMLRGYRWAGAAPGQRTLYLWAGLVGKQKPWQVAKERTYHRLFNRRMLDSFPMRDDNLDQYADAIERWAPEVIVSYVTPIVRLSEWMVRTGRVIKGVKSVLGASEALHQHHRTLIEAAFPGAVAYDTYGCREFMLIASECECRDGLHVNADHLVLELLDEGGRPSDSGEVILTDLGNYGMPFIRYRNGDMATMAAASPCACGRGLPRLRSVDGRKLDGIRSPQGALLPGIFFPHMLKDVPGVRRFQVRQRRLDALDIAVVAGPQFNEEQQQFVRREIARVLGEGVAVDLHLVDDIPLTPSGKLRVTISELE